LSVVEEEGQVGVRSGTLRSETGGGSGRLRLGGSLAHSEAPCNSSRFVFGNIGFDVLEGEDVVRSVGTSNVGVESGESDPLILVLEEPGENVEYGEARVDNVLEDLSLGGSIRGCDFSVSSLSDRGLEDLLELDKTFVEGRKLGVDENFTSLERDLGSGLRIEFSEILENGTEGGFDEGKGIGFLDEFKKGEDDSLSAEQLALISSILA